MLKVKFYGVSAILAGTLICGTFACGQSAKTLFGDPTSGATISVHGSTNGAASAVTPPSGPAVTTAPEAANAAKPGAHTRVRTSYVAPRLLGLNFWIVMLGRNGELRQVSASHVFHTGDRIRFYVRSNVNGYLTIVSKQQGEETEQLFPSSGSKENYLPGLHEVALPSPKGWFKFDEHPGELAVFMTLQRETPGEPAPPTVAANQVEQQAGDNRASKQLKLEEDDASDKPSSYAVQQVAYEPSGGPSKSISIKVRLHHAQ